MRVISSVSFSADKDSIYQGTSGTLAAINLNSIVNGITHVKLTSANIRGLLLNNNMKITLIGATTEEHESACGSGVKDPIEMFTPFHNEPVGGVPIVESLTSEGNIQTILFDEILFASVQNNPRIVISGLIPQYYGFDVTLTRPATIVGTNWRSIRFVVVEQ